MSASSNNSENKQAFVDLYSAHARRIYSYTLMLVPNTADADDVFQEVSQVLWEKYDQFEAGTNFYAWSCRIVQFQVMYYRQKLRREHRSRLEFSDDFLAVVGQQALDEAEALEQQHRVLRQCLEKLTPRVRKLMQLRFTAGATTKSVAAQIGQSVETVYKAINRAQKSLIECGQRLLSREVGP
jgi:RNA polymerase sigma-70 factor (ECF subfamily)